MNVIQPFPYDFAILSYNYLTVKRKCHGNACSTATPLPAWSRMLPCSPFVNINLVIALGEFTVKVQISGPLAIKLCMFLFALGGHTAIRISINAMRPLLIAFKLLLNSLGKHKLSQHYITPFKFLPRIYKKQHCWLYFSGGHLWEIQFMIPCNVDWERHTLSDWKSHFEKWRQDATGQVKWVCLFLTSFLFWVY